MAVGDAAAAAGLITWASTQDIRLGYNNDNQLGDYIARVMARATKLETSVKSPKTVIDAGATGATIPSTGGTLGVTTIVAVTAAAFKRVIEIDCSALVTGVGSGASLSPYVDVVLRKNGSAIRSWRVNDGQESAGGHLNDVLAANTAVTYQLVVTAPKAAAVTDNSSFTYLSVGVPTVAVS